MAIRILIDSASDISIEEAKKLGVSMIPLTIKIGDKQYYDGVDLLPKEFFEKLIEENELPKTSQITPFRFEEEFQRLTENGDKLLVITISSKLSGTYASAMIAASEFEGKVFVVDSLNACIGERLLCEYALKLIKMGLKIEEIVQELNEKKKKINLLAMVSTLEYLKKGGRISAVAAVTGELLSIKPVISIINGEVKVIGKAIGSKKGNNLLCKIVEKKGGIDFSMPYGIVWSGLDDSVLKKYVRDSAHLWAEHTGEIKSYIIGSTIGTHVGPGAIGVAFFEK